MSNGKTHGIPFRHTVCFFIDFLLCSMTAHGKANQRFPICLRICPVKPLSSGNHHCIAVAVVSHCGRCLFNSQMLAAYLHQLMLSLAETGAVSAVSSAPDAVVFRQAISYLNNNIHRQPSVPELARFCNISESGLKRIFDKYAGIGIHKYLLKLKIKTAAELLQQGESVSCVAEKLGLNSQSYFSRAFRRETGVMPSSLK